MRAKRQYTPCAAKLGSELRPEVQAECLRAFVHRYTGQHTPAWVTWEPVQFLDDADWLAHSYFRVKSDNTLDNRVRHCLSVPTWPNNPELRRA